MTSDQRRTIRTVVVDDQQVMREGLVALVGLLDDVEVLGSAGNGAEALALLADHGGLVDVVLMDLSMPVMDGIAATRRISIDYPDTAVLVLTTYSDEDSVAAALAAGARGYLTKEVGRAEIGAALRSATAGQSTFGADVSSLLVTALTESFFRTAAAPTERVEELPDGLTTREAEILGLIGVGMTNRDIAGKLYISTTTVKTHINNGFRKIGASNRSEAASYVVEHGLRYFGGDSRP